MNKPIRPCHSKLEKNQFGVDHQATWIFSLFVGLRSIYAHGNSMNHELLAVNHHQTNPYTIHAIAFDTNLSLGRLK